MPECCTVKTVRPTAPAVMDCPVCGSRSRQVGLLTVKSLPRHLRFVMPVTQYYFCTVPGCDVVYFPLNPKAPSFSRDDLWVRVGSKEPTEEATVCYCFGISRRQIRDEIEATGRCSAAEKIREEIRAGHCACELKNPSGKCCLGEVTKVVVESQKSSRAGLAKG